MRILRFERILRGDGTFVISSVDVMVAVWMSFSNSIFTSQYEIWNIKCRVLCYSLLFSWWYSRLKYYQEIQSESNQTHSKVTDCFIIIIWMHLLTFSRSWLFIIVDVISEHFGYYLANPIFRIEQSLLWACGMRIDVLFAIWCDFIIHRHRIYIFRLSSITGIFSVNARWIKSNALFWIPIGKDISILIIYFFPPSFQYSEFNSAKSRYWQKCHDKIKSSRNACKFGIDLFIAVD